MKSHGGIRRDTSSQRERFTKKMTDKQDHALENGAVEDTAPTKPVSRVVRWYRSPLFNVILVGLISFTQPGIWNALNSIETMEVIEPRLWLT